MSGYSLVPAPQGGEFIVHLSAPRCRPRILSHYTDHERAVRDLAAIKNRMSSVILVSDGNHVLASQRSAACKFKPGAWQLPGGKVDTQHWESAEDGAVRELMEETGIQINTQSLIHLGGFDPPCGGLYPAHLFLLYVSTEDLRRPFMYESNKSTPWGIIEPRSPAYQNSVDNPVMPMMFAFIEIGMQYMRDVGHLLTRIPLGDIICNPHLHTPDPRLIRPSQEPS
jgi:8-oxo-dGTP pyrophosphatase MutT (NUDIX family)